jgi:hypothetical protein
MHSKKAEGVFGMSFSMIFSIILIISFICAGFYAISHFLNWQKNTEIVLFMKNLQIEVDDAWNSGSASFNFTASLPKQISYVCIINFSAPPIKANQKEMQLFNEIRKQGYNAKNNLFIYSADKDYGVKEVNINHISMNEKNPTCIKTLNGKITIKIEKQRDNLLVTLKE